MILSVLGRPFAITIIIKQTEQKKGAQHGIRHCSVGCSSFSVCDYAFITPNIRKERKMDLVIGILVVIILVFGIVWLMQRT
jgi:hypothetical protein